MHMCSNFQPIKKHHANWVIEHFGCDLPAEGWREEAYPTYLAPFIFLDEGKPRCDLAQFGLIPRWAAEKKKFGLHTYNARSETVNEKPTYRNAWKERRFGFVLMESFYEPNWETGKAIRWRIKRTDQQPALAASIWERFTDKETGEIITSFSMLTINADGHEVMKHFHRSEDEKRSIVILKDDEYQPWLYASTHDAMTMLKLDDKGFLESEPAPKDSRI